MHRWKLAGCVALITLVVCYNVMAFPTERIAIAQLLLSFALVITMMTIKFLWRVTEDAAPIVSFEDL